MRPYRSKSRQLVSSAISHHHRMWHHKTTLYDAPPRHYCDVHARISPVCDYTSQVRLSRVDEAGSTHYVNSSAPRIANGRTRESPPATCFVPRRNDRRSLYARSPWPDSRRHHEHPPLGPNRHHSIIVGRALAAFSGFRKRLTDRLASNSDPLAHPSQHCQHLCSRQAPPPPRLRATSTPTQSQSELVRVTKTLAHLRLSSRVLTCTTTCATRPAP